jgi:hypothetical protein
MPRLFFSTTCRSSSLVATQTPGQVFDIVVDALDVPFGRDLGLGRASSASADPTARRSLEVLYFHVHLQEWKNSSPKAATD